MTFSDVKVSVDNQAKQRALDSLGLPIFKDDSQLCDKDTVPDGKLKSGYDMKSQFKVTKKACGHMHILAPSST